MAFNKISGQSAIPPMLPICVQAGENFILPAGQGLVGGFGAVSPPQIGTNNPLTGQYMLTLGQYTNLQVFNAGMQCWETVNVNPYAQVPVSSDGFNYRIANSTGCPVGAVITNAGSSYANGFYGYNQAGAATTIIGGVVTAGQTYLTVTPSAGSSLWNAIFGGAISGTMSVSGTVYNGNYGVTNTFGATTGGVTASGGSAYTLAPLVVFSPPANQGQQPYILPTAYSTISAGAVSAITVLDQGCGLLGLPGVTLVNQPGDTTGGGAVVGWSASNNGNIGTGTMLALWPASYGAPQTSVVTITFSATSGSSAAATLIMNFSVTSITNTTAGVAYVGAAAFWQGGITVATPASNTAIRYSQVISQPQFPVLKVAATTGVCTLPAANMFQGVNIQAIPTIAVVPQVIASTGLPTTVAVQTPAVGGVNDVVKLITF